MPHRTVFQWGSNHAHPFTMFLGGFVIGAIATGVVIYAWMAADDADIEVQDAVIETVVETAAPQATATVRPTASPTASLQF